MSLRKIDFSSMKSILDAVNGEELYNVIGGCGGSGGALTYILYKLFLRLRSKRDP